jgi:hypothetical protein
VIASQGDEAARARGPVGGERPHGIERIQLFVQGVASIFRRKRGVIIGKRKIVERSMHRITEYEDRDHTRIAVLG